VALSAIFRSPSCGCQPQDSIMPNKEMIGARWCLARPLWVPAALQALLLTSPVQAERNTVQTGELAGAAVSRHSISGSEYNSTEESEPLLKGTLSQNLEQLEREKVELERSLSEKIDTLIESRKQMLQFREELWNVTALYKRLVKQKQKNDRKIAMASSKMLNISAQYEAQVHAAKVALACLEGSCGVEDMKIWDTWACRGRPSAEALTTPDPFLTTEEPSTTEEFAPPGTTGNPGFGLKPGHVEFIPNDVLVSTTAPSSTFAVGTGSEEDIDDSMEDTFPDEGSMQDGFSKKGGEAGDGGKMRGGKNEETVKVFVGDKKVVEVKAPNASVTVKGQKLPNSEHDEAKVAVQAEEADVKREMSKDDNTDAADKDEVQEVPEKAQAEKAGAARVAQEAMEAKEPNEPNEPKEPKDAKEQAVNTTLPAGRTDEVEQILDKENARTKVKEPDGFAKDAASNKTDEEHVIDGLGREDVRPEEQQVVKELGNSTGGHPNLDGNWSHLVEQRPSVEEIKGQTVHWSSNNVTTFEWSAKDEVTMKMANDTYTGKFKDNQLIWSDGDVWTRAPKL